MDDQPASKSQKKREADMLQQLGVQLIGLKILQLNTIPLPPKLYTAIIEAKSMNSHGAQRRQQQFIGKLMRKADTEAIIKAYEQLQQDAAANSATRNQVTWWQSQLTTRQDSALTEFINQYQPDDLQQLRQLVKKAAKESPGDKPTHATKALFRYLRSYIK